MKRFFVFLLCASLMTVFSACSKEEASSVNLSSQMQPSNIASVSSKQESSSTVSVSSQEVPSQMVNVLKGKTVLFCGDSICYGEWDTVKGYAWAGRIAKRCDLEEADNQALGGYCFSTTRGDQWRILHQLEKVQQNTYDYVILQGGVNDAAGHPGGPVYAQVGTMSDSFDVEDFDRNTFAGGFEETIYYAKQYFPNAKFGFIISFYMPNASKEWNQVSDMKEYWEVAKQICDKWEIPYLDLYFDDYISNTVMQVTTNICLRDPVHPNATGYERLTPFIANWMQTL